MSNNPGRIICYESHNRSNHRMTFVFKMDGDSRASLVTTNDRGEILQVLVLRDDRVWEWVAMANSLRSFDVESSPPAAWLPPGLGFLALNDFKGPIRGLQAIIDDGARFEIHFNTPSPAFLSLDPSTGVPLRLTWETPGLGDTPVDILDFQTVPSIPDGEFQIGAFEAEIKKSL